MFKWICKFFCGGPKIKEVEIIKEVPVEIIKEVIKEVKVPVEVKVRDHIAVSKGGIVVDLEHYLDELDELMVWKDKFSDRLWKGISKRLDCVADLNLDRDPQLKLEPGKLFHKTLSDLDKINEKINKKGISKKS